MPFLKIPLVHRIAVWDREDSGVKLNVDFFLRVEGGGLKGHQ